MHPREQVESVEHIPLMCISTVPSKALAGFARWLKLPKGPFMRSSQPILHAHIVVPEKTLRIYMMKHESL